MDNNKLIIFNQNNLPERVSNTLMITEKLIGSSDRELVLEILKNNRNLFINLISNFYPLSEKLISRYINDLD